jgi:hypothetical protein
MVENPTVSPSILSPLHPLLPLTSGPPIHLLRELHPRPPLRRRPHLTLAADHVLPLTAGPGAEPPRSPALPSVAPPAQLRSTRLRRGSLRRSSVLGGGPHREVCDGRALGELAEEFPPRCRAVGRGRRSSAASTPRACRSGHWSSAASPLCRREGAPWPRAEGAHGVGPRREGGPRRRLVHGGAAPAAGMARSGGAYGGAGVARSGGREGGPKWRLRSHVMR